MTRKHITVVMIMWHGHSTLTGFFPPPLSSPLLFSPSLPSLLLSFLLCPFPPHSLPFPLYSSPFSPIPSLPSPLPPPSLSTPLLSPPPLPSPLPPPSLSTPLLSPPLFPPNFLPSLSLPSSAAASTIHKRLAYLGALASSSFVTTLTR